MLVGSPNGMAASLTVPKQHSHRGSVADVVYLHYYKDNSGDYKF